MKGFKAIIVTALGLALLLFLLRWLEYRFLIVNSAQEIYSGAIALVFLGLGIWLTLKLVNRKTVVIEKEVLIHHSKEFTRNEESVTALGLSKRELEVLELMAEGLSNIEIGNRLFLSLNTVKTHAANLFEKLEVKRRTQAVEAGRRLGIIS